jgi:general secretion pathway protein G
MKSIRGRQAAFSLVELVIVIVIIGIIAAIAVPRISRGAKGATQSAVRGDVAALRAAIDLYAAEHNGVFPGKNTSTGSPGGVAADMIKQLTLYSDINGATGDYNTIAGRIYGPYLRNGIPPLPVGTNAGEKTVVFTTGTPTGLSEGTGEGWAYNPDTGEIRPNTTATDESGDPYSDY